MNTCIHKQYSSCRLASTLAQKEAATTPQACAACLKTERPMGLNVVTCSLAYAASKEDDLLTLFKQLSKTLYNNPGSALKDIFQELGIYEGTSCECDEYATKMNTWGTEGCILRIDEIVAHLNSQDKSWFIITKVVLAGYLTTESLVREAIKRSKEIKK